MAVRTLPEVESPTPPAEAWDSRTRPGSNVLVALVEPDAHRLHRAAAGRLGTMTVWMATDQGAADIKNRTHRSDVWSLHASALRAGCSCG